MKIGIDLRCLLEEEKTGVGEYAIAIIKKLLKEDQGSEFIFFLNSYKEIKTDLGWIKKFPNARIKRFRYPNKILNLFFWFLDWPKVDRIIGGVDVFFMPNFSFISLSKECRKILTIHDLSFELFPESFSLKRRLWHFMVNPRRLCVQSDKVFTVSESTKQDLIYFYKIESKKIKTVYPPFNHEDFAKKITEKEKQRVVKKYNLPNDFILFLGTIEPRKNIVSLIRAFDKFKNENFINCSYLTDRQILKKEGDKRDLKLVIAGGKGWLWEKTFKQATSSNSKDKIIFTNFIAEEDKATLYKLARIFVFPSFFEGFGFPPLEAMASGSPVIASNCSSMPEILDEAVILINPYRPKEITLALNQLENSQALYEYYSKKGIERVKKITSLERIFEITNKK